LQKGIIPERLEIVVDATRGYPYLLVASEHRGELVFTLPYLGEYLRGEL
jgi:hypothetical protein